MEKNCWRVIRVILLNENEEYSIEFSFGKSTQIIIEIKFLKCIIVSLGSILLFSNVTDIWHLLYCIFDIVYSYYMQLYNTETWNFEISIWKC